MNKIKLFLISCMAIVAFSCNDLDVSPLTIVGNDDLLTTDQGVSIYMSNLYGDLPMWTLDGIGAGLADRNSDRYTGYLSGRDASLFQVGRDVNGWWSYAPIREINNFIEKFPAYASKFDPVKANAYMGEAYFLRAFYYFSMVKRYGGVPIIDHVLNYPEQTPEELTYPRSKEVDCYTFILGDLDEAIKLLPAKSDGVVLATGRANRYVALGIKARVALYAGSIARYGIEDYQGGLLGIPSNLAAGYFEQAYAAADATKDGGYELYNAEADKAANFTNIFGGGNDGVTLPKESMFARTWVTTHSVNYAGNNEPYQLSPSWGSQSQPFLEMIEYFEDKNGNPFNLEARIGTQNAPIYYDSPIDVFEDLEPRAKGTFILPMSTFIGKEVEIRKGILKEGGSLTNLNADLLVSGSAPLNNDQRYNGMYIQGQSGIGVQGGCWTGFLVRKWLSPVKTSIDWQPTGCLTPYIELRYAEMLLTKAEAAVELGQHLDVAVDCINQIRERAGSTKRFTTATLTKEAVRKERRLEFFDEDKTYWDFRRWRIADIEQTGGSRHVLWPIYVWDQKQYYLHKTVDQRGNLNPFISLWYYNPIPTSVIANNKLIVPNPSNGN